VNRTVHVELAMGTAFTIDVRDPGDWTEPVSQAVQWLHHVDAVFSPYRPDSVVSRLGRGEVRPADCPEEVRHVLSLCDEVASATQGCFTARPAGRLDPSGMVKGWAVERASDLLRAAGSANHAVNGGGDMQLAGEASPGLPWRVGVEDPHRPGSVVTVVAGRDLAVATSGTAARGAHVVDPRSGEPAGALTAVTLVGRHLTYVDAYATAALVMGEQARDWVERLEGYEAFAVRPDGTTWQTSGFAALTPAHAPHG
jgi:thiamine biosynthesis lipoprotein